MLKQIFIPILLMGACCIASFMPASKEETTTLTVAKVSPKSQINLYKAGAPLSGGGTADVLIIFENSTYTIVDLKLYVAGNPCVQYYVTGYTGGPITLAGGKYRTVNPIYVTYGSGTATVSGAFSTVAPICLDRRATK